MDNRNAAVQRITKETNIELLIRIDGTGSAAISTGIGFLDHMLTAFATHARIDLELKCAGDLDVDDHHTVEDCAIVLGEGLNKALGNKRGIRRFGAALAPMDESLTRAIADISGRPCACVDLSLRRDTVGGVACENIAHFFTSFAMAARLTLHVDVLRGENDHHKAESAFKALALAVREAIAQDGDPEWVPSTKGVL